MARRRKAAVRKVGRKVRRAGRKKARRRKAAVRKVGRKVRRAVRKKARRRKTVRQTLAAMLPGVMDA
jgi:hypothetical protein